MKKWTQNRISERWGIPFWDIVRDLEFQGLNRTQAAAALGMEKNGFTMLMRNNPDTNPWGSPNVVANFVRDTGETFRGALERMSREGYSINAASRAIGFSGRSTSYGLVYAMKARGIEIDFTWVPPVKEKPKKVDRGPNVTKGWPTWEKVYGMARPAQL